MPRKYVPIKCSKSDILELRKLSASSHDPRLASRARMVLRCVEGAQIKDIASEMGERPNTVIQWRKRYEAYGIDGLINRPRGANANKYGRDLSQRILEKLNTMPPSGSARWTGTSLSKELGVTPDVIWRFLRRENISLTDLTATYDNPDLLQAAKIYEVPLRLTLRKDGVMSDKKNTVPASENMDLVITARVIGKDGTVIEKEIRLDDAIPNIADFDLETMEGFRRDFDKLERSILDARQQLSSGLTEEYMEKASKKNRRKKSE
jgi:transposase